MIPVRADVSRWRNALANLLCAVGLSGAVGAATGFFPLAILGQRYLVAPLPIVFSQADGRETIAGRFSVRVETVNGESFEFGDGGKEFSHAIDGPFLRRVSYVARAAFFVRSDDKQSKTALRFGFCDGPLPAELGISAPVKRVHVRAWSAISREGVDHSLEIECHS